MIFFTRVFKDLLSSSLQNFFSHRLVLMSDEFPRKKGVQVEII